MRIDIITVLPEMIEGFVHESILARAEKKGLAEIHLHNLRDYTLDKWRRVDDYPYGGFAGMVMQCEPIDRAISALKGCEPQLRAHAQGALNMGVSEAELRALPAVLQASVGEEEAYRLRQAIAAVFNEPFTEGAPVEAQLFPQGEPNTAYAKYFIGNSYLAPLASGEGQLGVANVTFEPRCHNNWHIHHRGGQILICVGGRGWYQEWGKPARELHPGDVVDIPAEAKHWHGAARDSWFQHIAIGVPAEGATTTWLEAVEDEVYDKLP